MKILHVLHYPDNGIVTVVFDQIRHSTTPGVEYHVVLLQRSLKVDRMAADYQIRLHYLSRDSVEAMNDYRRVLRNIEPDVIHTHSYRPRLITALAVKMGWWNGGAVTTIHTEYPYLTRGDWRSRFKRMTEIASMRTLRCPIVVNNRRVYEVMAKTSIGRAFGVHKIYNGVSLPPMDRGPSTGREPVVINVARFTPEKNHGLLLEAWTDVVRRVPAARLWLLGDGELQAAMEEKARKLGIADSVVFWGWIHRAEVPTYLAHAQVFVLSSFHEGLSTVAIEASLAGLPVVSTDVAGIDEIVERDKTGLVVTSRRAMADALVDLLTDPARCDAMGRLGRRRAESLFGIDGFVKELESLYCAVAPEHAVPALPITQPGAQTTAAEPASSRKL